MLRYSLSLLVLLLLMFIMQQFLPTWSSFYEARLFLVLSAFLCISVTVPLPIVFLLATVCGFLWDAQTVLIPDHALPELTHHVVQTPRFGTSILLFGLFGALMNGIRTLFQAGKWYWAFLFFAVSAFLYLITEYAIIDFMRNDFSIDPSVVKKAAASAALCSILTPVFYFILKVLAHFSQYRIVEENRTRRRTL